MTPANYSVTPELDRNFTRIQGRSMVVGLVAVVLMIIGAFLDPAQFFKAWLAGYMFALGAALGCMALLMVHHLTGGSWGIVIRRVMEAGTRTLPVLIVLFIPILFGLHVLYPWTHTEVVEQDAILQLKTPYLNLPFFFVRLVVYFAVWLLLAYFLNKWSIAQDAEWTNERYVRLQRLSGGGLLLYAATITFAAVDWVMSLDPHWFSTIWGILFMGGQAVTAMAFIVIVMAFLSRRDPLAHVVSRSHLHDWGKLLFAFIMLWAYFNVSQFIIIWSANLPEEIPYYLARMHGPYGVLGLIVVLLHFALPFALLLSRDLKRNYRTLARVAAGLLVMRAVDLTWIIAPMGHGHNGGGGFPWMYFIAPIALGGIWFWAFLREFRRRPLLPHSDPHLQEALAHGSH